MVALKNMSNRPTILKVTPTCMIRKNSPALGTTPRLLSDEIYQPKTKSNDRRLRPGRALADAQPRGTHERAPLQAHL